MARVTEHTKSAKGEAIGIQHVPCNKTKKTAAEVLHLLSGGEYGKSE